MAIYFDNGATSYPKPEVVYESIDNYMRNNGSSAGRGNYRKAVEASELVYGARRSVAKVLGVKSPSKIVFTANITESLNLVLKGFLESGDKVLTTNYEHNAMWRPLKRLEAENEIEIKELHCNERGLLDFDELKSALAQKPKLFCFAHGSNVLANVLPLQEIAELAHDSGVPILVDTAQTAGIIPIDATAWGIDFLAFTGHKSLLGPMGTGGLYIHGDVFLKTLKEGGTGSSSSSPLQPKNMPDRFESGTMNIPAIVGLKAATEYLADIGIENVYKHEKKLITILISAMEKMPEITLYGANASDARLGLISFNIGEYDPYDLSTWLDEHYSIMVRSGLHCSPQAHRLMGTERRGSVRISLNLFNTEEEVKICIKAINDFIETEGK